MYVDAHRLVVMVSSIVYSIGIESGRCIFKCVVYALLGHTGHRLR